MLDYHPSDCCPVALGALHGHLVVRHVKVQQMDIVLTSLLTVSTLGSEKSPLKETEDPDIAPWMLLLLEKVDSGFSQFLMAKVVVFIIFL